MTVKSLSARILSETNQKMPIAKRIVPFGLRRSIMRQFFSQTAEFDPLPERQWIKHHILPTLADANLERIVFIGAAPYTFHYEFVFRGTETEYITLDHNPATRIWGAKRHISSGVADIGLHLKPSSIDAVLMIGVYGFGVYEADLDKVLQELSLVLKPGGLLVFSWNSDVSSDPISHKAFGNFEHAAALGLPARKRFQGYSLVLDVLKK